MASTDEELIRSIAAGDRQAFSDFYDRHDSAIFGLIMKLIRRRSDAEDVLQETFLQVWRQAERFDPTRGTALGWLLMIARSRSMDRLRQKPPAVTSEPPEIPVLSETDSSLEREETTNQVRRALNELPDDQRSAIDLAFFGGLTYEQVAVRQAIPVGTAKTRIRLGLIRLRKVLAEPCDGGSIG